MESGHEKKEPLAVLIREMRIEDVEHVYAIETTAYPSPWPIECFIGELTSNNFSRYFVAESEGQIIGYAGIWVIGDEAHVTNVAVDPWFRCRKVAEQLLLYLIEYSLACGVRSMFLEVRRFNIAAQRLYTRYRFVPTRVREKYYQDNLEDAIELRVEDTAERRFMENYQRRRAKLAAALAPPL